MEPTPAQSTSSSPSSAVPPAHGVRRRSLPLLAAGAAALVAGPAALAPARADGGDGSSGATSGNPASDASSRGSSPTVPTTRDAEDLLHRIGARSRARSRSGRIWSPLATGYAGIPTDDLPLGAVGGLGGETVVVSDSAALAEAAARAEPLVILVDGLIEVEPFGSMIDVSSHTTIAGLGKDAQIVGGGLRLLQVQDVVIRNLTFRDSYVAGDFDGKSADNDNDGIRVDTSDHVWIDHCEFARLGDGTVDIRKDSTAVTVSWCIFRDHNKTLGVGWTDNVLTTLTVHHCRFSNTHQRNGSVDNVAAGHWMNTWHAGISSYGTAARGAGQVLVEGCVYEHVRNPIGASDEDSRITQIDTLLVGCWGKDEDTGLESDQSAAYDLPADPASDVIDLVGTHGGPIGRRELTARGKRPGRTVVVAQDGSGDVSSIHAALGAAWRSARTREIVIRPGIYREVLTVWPGSDGLTIRGETGDPADVLVTYDKPVRDWATATVLSGRVSISALTLETTYAGEDPSAALRTVHADTVLEDVVLHGARDTTDPR